MNDVKKIAKELCEKSPCHHKCHDTKDCIVEDEALLLINQNKSNNFDVKSNNELFKQALVEGVNRRIDKIIEEEKQIEEMAKILCGMKNGCDGCMWSKEYCNERNYAEEIYNAGYRKQSEGEWISVEHRLPEESGEYLVFGRTFGNKKPQIWICECISIGSVMGWCNNAKNPIVEAWMPLPEAPKMKGGE